MQRYDLIAIGGGTTGLVATAGAARGRSTGPVKKVSGSFARR